MAHTREHGGATVDVKTGEHYDKSKGGFGVALLSGTFMKVPAKAPLREHHEAMQKTSRYPGATHMGTWLNRGVVHYDPVEVIKDQPTAEKRGRERKQEAIYDYANDREITL